MDNGKKNTSSANILKDPGEERFPLLLQLLEEDKSRSECSCETHRSSKVSHGVAMVLGKWPNNITAGCISAVFLSALIFATILMILTILVITTIHSDIAHRVLLGRETALLEIETSCDYREEQGKIEVRKTAKYNLNVNLFNFLGLQSPLLKKRDVSDSNETNFQVQEQFKAFFVTTYELLSPHHVCSIESAARIMKNYTFYLIILTSERNKKQPNDKRIVELVAVYKNIKLHRVKGEKYFHDSPIGNLLEKNKYEPSLIVFAARVLTLWRYGGITFDLDLLTVNNYSDNSYPLPFDFSVMLSGIDGSVMSVRMQCHAFLFEIMLSLKSFLKEGNGNKSITSSDVIDQALNSFCYNVTNNYESSRFCKGVSAMPERLICSKTFEKSLSPTDCIWTSVNGSSLRLRQKICPLTYRTHTSANERKYTKFATHKRKVKF